MCGASVKRFNKLSKMDFCFFFSNFWFWAFKILVPSNLCPYVHLCVCVCVLKNLVSFGVFFFLVVFEICGYVYNDEVYKCVARTIMMRFVKCVIEAVVIFHAHFGVLIHQGIILKKIQKLKRDILF